MHVSPNHTAPPTLCQVPPVRRAPIAAALLVYTVDHGGVTVFAITPEFVVTISMTLDALLARTRTTGSETYPHEVSVTLVSGDVPAPLHRTPPFEIRVHPGPKGAAGSITQKTLYGLESEAMMVYCPLAQVGHWLKTSKHEV